MTELLEIRKLSNGSIQARRTDGKRLTLEDRQSARRLADVMRGITPNDVVRIFPGARILTAQEAVSLSSADGLAQ